MSDVAIRVEGLSKLYRLGAQECYRTLRETITGAFHHKSVRRSRPQIWALDNVSFEVKRGEVIGIIGRNGAGKSTLLKILSRITEPTKGRVEIHGRLGSLLEVGTGFHPELTGRENILLNGAILGMKRAEILRKFDEIVAFAEVERFIDTPVKHYSSGMYVRLAFAVAAHLSPDILLVDEVLAVGDLEFQKKCLGTMEAAAHREGRTVLFVSHNMQSISRLCSRALLLAGGRKESEGESRLVIDKYLNDGSWNLSLADVASTIRRLPPDPAFRLRELNIVQCGKSGTDVISGEELEIVVEYDIFQKAAGFCIYLCCYDADRTLLFDSLHNGNAETTPTVYPGRYVSRGVIPADLLAGRRYDFEISAAIHAVRDCIPQPTPLRIPINVTAVGQVNRAYPGYVTPGKLAPLIPWHTERIEPSATRVRIASSPVQCQNLTARM